MSSGNGGEDNGGGLSGDKKRISKILSDAGHWHVSISKTLFAYCSTLKVEVVTLSPLNDCYEKEIVQFTLGMRSNF